MSNAILTQLPNLFLALTATRHIDYQSVWMNIMSATNITAAILHFYRCLIDECIGSDDTESVYRPGYTNVYLATMAIATYILRWRGTRGSVWHREFVLPLCLMATAYVAPVVAWQTRQQKQGMKYRLLMYPVFGFVYLAGNEMALQATRSK